MVPCIRQSHGEGFGAKHDRVHGFPGGPKNRVLVVNGGLGGNADYGVNQLIWPRTGQSDGLADQVLSGLEALPVFLFTVVEGKNSVFQGPVQTKGKAFVPGLFAKEHVLAQ
jgi:hypothetical protein